jgi:hypothetical protein
MRSHNKEHPQYRGFIKMFITIILKEVFDEYKSEANANVAPPHLQVLHNHLNNTQRSKQEGQRPELYVYKKYIMILLHEAGVVSPDSFAKFSGDSSETTQMKSGSLTHGPDTPSEGEIHPMNGQLSPLQVHCTNNDTCYLRSDNGQPVPSNHGHYFQPLTGEEEVPFIRSDENLFELILQEHIVQ